MSAQSELDKHMAKMAAMGVTVTTRLAPGVPESDRAATRIRDAARRAGIDGAAVSEEGKEQ